VRELFRDAAVSLALRQRSRPSRCGGEFIPIRRSCTAQQILLKTQWPLLVSPFPSALVRSSRPTVDLRFLHRATLRYTRPGRHVREYRRGVCSGPSRSYRPRSNDGSKRQRPLAAVSARNAATSRCIGGGPQCNRYGTIAGMAIETCLDEAPVRFGTLVNSAAR